MSTPQWPVYSPDRVAGQFYSYE